MDETTQPRCSVKSRVTATRPVNSRVMEEASDGVVSKTATLEKRIGAKIIIDASFCYKIKLLREN